MNFRCPGCGEIERGALAFDQDRPDAAAVLCGPCIAHLVLARVGGGVAVLR